MEKKIKIGLIVLVIGIVLIGIWAMLSKQPIISEEPTYEELHNCSTDSDCVIVSLPCNDPKCSPNVLSYDSSSYCPVVINSKYRNYWNQNLPFVEEYMIMVSIPCNPNQDFYAKCKNNRCTIWQKIEIKNISHLDSIAFPIDEDKFEVTYNLNLVGEIINFEPYYIWEEDLLIALKDETTYRNFLLKSFDKRDLKKGQRIRIKGKVVDSASVGFMVEDASVKILSEEK